MQKQQYAALQRQLEQAQKEEQRLLDRIKELMTVSEDELRAALTDEQAGERFAAAYAVGERELVWHKDLIERLNDQRLAVRQAARRSLMILSYLALYGKDKEPEPAPTPPTTEKPVKPMVKRPVDFGPVPAADKGARATAMRKWTAWWAERDDKASSAKSPGSGK